MNHEELSIAELTALMLSRILSAERMPEVASVIVNFEEKTESTADETICMNQDSKQ